MVAAMGYSLVQPCRFVLLVLTVACAVDPPEASTMDGSGSSGGTASADSIDGPGMSSATTTTGVSDSSGPFLDSSSGPMATTISMDGTTTGTGASTGSATGGLTTGSDTEGLTTGFSTGGFTTGFATGGFTTGIFPTDDGGSITESCNIVAGSYDDCLLPGGGIDLFPCGPNPSVCITDPVANFGVCSVQGCDDACQCPAPPPGGTPGCDELTGDNENDCFLDCSGGLPCPGGYSCFAATLCVPTPPQPLPPFGDCVSTTAMCSGDDICLVDAFPPDYGACATPCIDVGDCADPGPGLTVTCSPVLPADDACIIDCSMNGLCPAGMDCFDNQICLWPA